MCLNLSYGVEVEAASQRPLVVYQKESDNRVTAATLVTAFQRGKCGFLSCDDGHDEEITTLGVKVGV